MADNFLKLNKLELKFAKYALLIDNKGTEINSDDLSRFANLIGDYNKQINIFLKEYAKIDFQSLPEEKSQASARLKYAYDFMSLLTDLLKRLEVNPLITDDIVNRLILLEDFILKKPQLVQTYLLAARKELESFHDPKIREDLESFLKKKLEDRK